MSANNTIKAITSSRIIAIVREHSADSAKSEVTRLVSAGVQTIEVSLSTPGAIDVVRWMAETMIDDGLHFGVGTVLTNLDVEEAAAAGASFIVSPISHTDIIQTSKQLGIVSVVGAFTPTECIDAARAGADLIKLFPAGIWTLNSFRGLLKALPFLKLVPTGGIRLSDAVTWLDAGAVAVGIGGGFHSAGGDAELRKEVMAVAMPHQITTP